MSSYATSSRMYDVAPAAARAWQALFGAAFADAGLDVRRIEHAYPEPIAALWARRDLMGAFMCGWPWSRGEPRLQVVAAPVPSFARYGGLPRYCSDYVARRASGYRTLEDAFGERFGWMAADSQSGFNAPRAHLAAFATGARPRLFREVRGPLGTPARTLAALAAGEVDLVALDGFWLDLLRHHEPARLEALEVVGSTPWTPIPLVVAAHEADPGDVARLRERLLGAHEDPARAPLLAQAGVARFVEPGLGDYGLFERMAGEAARRGYAAIA